LLGSLAVVVMLLYGYTVYFAVRVALCANDSTCTTYKATDFGDNWQGLMNGTGGLVSATVFAKFGAKPPAQLPQQENFGITTLTPNAENSLKVVVVVYGVGWFLIGLVALVVGVLTAYQKVPALTNLGQAWFGLAIASLYAYLGIKPTEAGK